MRVYGKHHSLVRYVLLFSRVWRLYECLGSTPSFIFKVVCLPQIKRKRKKTGFPFYFGKLGASFNVKSTCVVHSKTIIPLTVGETGTYLPPLLSIIANYGNNRPYDNVFDQESCFFSQHLASANSSSLTPEIASSNQMLRELPSSPGEAQIHTRNNVLFFGPFGGVLINLVR